MRALRFGIVVVAATALIPLTAGSASATPPDNDRPSGAIALSLGQTIKEDTTQATTGSLDAQANQRCGAPYTKASVWFSYSPSADGVFILDLSQSDYSGGIMVFHRAASPRTLFNCGPTSVAVRGVAGKTYVIMAFSDTQKQGGNLVASLLAGPPNPSLTATVDPTGKAYASGNARVSGTYTCENAGFVLVSGELTQVWRRLKINGFFHLHFEGTCDGQAHAWTRVVNSQDGVYAKGDATVSIRGIACGQYSCSRLKTSAQVTLSGSGHPSARASGSSKAHSPTRSAACASSRPLAMYKQSIACRVAAWTRS